MRITKNQLRRIIRKENKKYGKDFLSKTHKGKEGEMDNPELDYDEDEPTTNEGHKKLRMLIREILNEDKSGKGKCPPSGCIKQSDGSWRIISNKTGKLWPQKYKTRASAESALGAYHASRG